MMHVNPGCPRIQVQEESMTVSFHQWGGRLRDRYWYWMDGFSEVMIETKYGMVEIRTNGKELRKPERAETQACRGERLRITWECLSELQRPQVSLKVGIQLGFKTGGLVESL